MSQAERRTYICTQVTAILAVQWTTAEQVNYIHFVVRFLSDLSTHSHPGKHLFYTPSTLCLDPFLLTCVPGRASMQRWRQRGWYWWGCPSGTHASGGSRCLCSEAQDETAAAAAATRVCHSLSVTRGSACDPTRLHNDCTDARLATAAAAPASAVLATLRCCVGSVNRIRPPLPSLGCTLTVCCLCLHCLAVGCDEHAGHETQ